MCIRDSLMYCTESHNIPGLLILVEKAFDSTSWDFIYQVLWSFDVSNYVIYWIKQIPKIKSLIHQWKRS